MGVDPSQTIPSYAPAGPVERRRRRRSTHRNMKRRTPAVRRLQRIAAVLFMGVLVILASLILAQRFSAYEPPVQIVE